LRRRFRGSGSPDVKVGVLRDVAPDFIPMLQKPPARSTLSDVLLEWLRD
jgi:hypothetical protein